MRRLTEKAEGGTYQVSAEVIIGKESHYTGAAIERLAVYENAQESLELQYQQAVEKTEVLKAQGKLKTSTAQQLLAQKLTFSNMLNLLALHETDGDV